MHNCTLFLTLRIFSATGGIEKVSRVAGKALQEIVNGHPGEMLSVYSMYDATEEIDEKYFPAKAFRGFRKEKSKFVFEAVRRGINSKQVIMSHINLLLAGFLIKLFSPKTKLILLAHGIEVWSPLPAWKKYMLGKCDMVLAVSQFTKDKLILSQGFPEEKCTVLNNCLDPFLPPAPEPGKLKNQQLLQRYGLSADDIILVTLTRLSSREQYKGYDNMLYVISELKETWPQLRYLIIGKYDEAEKLRMEQIIDSLQLQGRIIFAGFIPEEELGDHYGISDMYIMPSKKEGFGIVFIEAMYYGKPVIAGNKDGSVDALCDGKFGLLVNPDNRNEIAEAVNSVISNRDKYIPKQHEVMEKFGYETYLINLKRLLGNLKC